MKYIDISCILIILLILTPTIWAQPSPPGPNSDPPYGGNNYSPSMGVIIIILVAALFFMGFFSIYIRHCSEDTSANGTAARRIGSLRRSRRAPRGLDPEVIASFPTFDYAAVKSEKIGIGALECAVCLTEFEDDDTLRLLPKCDHVFHPDCIDAWLVGHTTCPVCRCNLKDDASTVVGEAQPPQQQPPFNDIVVEVGDYEDDNNNDHRRLNSNSNSNSNENESECQSMEQPLQGRMTRNRTMRNLSFGRPRWLGRLARSFSTGHVAVKQWDNMERFTLRLPAELRKQIISGKLERTTSLLVLPRESSTRRGYRTGFGEGSSRGRVGSTRSERSDRWVFSLTPPFFSRAPSARSPKGMTMTTPIATTSSRGGSLRGGSLRGSVRDRENGNQEGSLRGNVQAELNQLPI